MTAIRIGSNVDGSGNRYRTIAVICAAVFHLPPRLAGITP
jgi:hypothetical protein